MDIVAGSNVYDLLSDDNFVGVLICGIVGLVAITAIIAWQWRRIRVTEAEVALKSQMIAQGYTAEQVEKVLSAGLQTARKRRGHSTKEQGCCSSDFVINR